MGHVKGDLSFEEMCNIVGNVARKYGVGHVYLFGSRARGDFHDSSDYDLCIELGRIDDLHSIQQFRNSS
jgi:predicted nucleotidyltransferase